MCCAETLAGEAAERKFDRYQPMGGHCSLLARKFDKKAVKALLKSAADCNSGFAFGPACIAGREV